MKTEDELRAFLNANIYPDGTHCVGFREKVIAFLKPNLSQPQAITLQEIIAVVAKVPIRFVDDPNGGMCDEIPVYLKEHHVENISRAVFDILPAQPQATWQQIASAPKDGATIIIGWWENQTWCERLAWWDPCFESISLKKYRGAWTDNAVQSFGYEEVCEYTPTNWMPLPPSPEKAAGG